MHHTDRNAHAALRAGSHRHQLTEQAQSMAMSLTDYWRQQTDMQAARYAGEIEARVRSIANTLIHYGAPA